METLIQNAYGYGIEQEAWIVNKSGHPITRIGGESAYLALRKEIQEITGNDPEWLSAELLSCQAEVKTTKVHTNTHEALEEINYHIVTANRALEQMNSSWYLETVAYKDMNGVELVAADPNAASFRRVQQWSQTEQGRELLRKTAICSMQLCVSAGLEDMDKKAKLRLLARCYNYLSKHYRNIQEINHYSPRLDIIENLIISVKKNNFVQAGLLANAGRSDYWITRPDDLTENDITHWYMAHSGVSEIAQIDSKDAHGLLLKGKIPKGSLDLVCMEHRWRDAGCDISNVVDTVYDLHEKMMEACAA